MVYCTVVGRWYLLVDAWWHRVQMALCPASERARLMSSGRSQFSQVVIVKVVSPGRFVLCCLLCPPVCLSVCVCVSLRASVCGRFTLWCTDLVAPSVLASSFSVCLFCVYVVVVIPPYTCTCRQRTDWPYQNWSWLLQATFISTCKQDDQHSSGKVSESKSGQTRVRENVSIPQHYCSWHKICKFFVPNRNSE